MSLNYYLTPWRWLVDQVTPGGCWQPPVGSVGWVDLTPTPQTMTRGEDAGLIFTAVDGELPGEDALGKGDLRELRPTARMRSMWQSAAGFAPAGNTLGDLLSSHLLNGDPEGLDRCNPLQPSNGALELWLAGHGDGPIAKEQFQWGGAYTNRLKALIRRSVRDLIKESDTGRLPLKAIRRLLDDYEKTYPGLTWSEIVPAGWDQPPLRRESTFTESFNTADTTTLGPDQTWDEYKGGSASTDLGVYGNRGSYTSDTVFMTLFARCTSGSVSSNNNWTTCDYAVECTNNPQAGPATRLSGASPSGYMLRELKFGNGQHLMTMVNGNFGSTLATNAAATATAPVSLMTEAIGSAIKGYRAGVNITSATNTTYTTGLQGGFYLYSGDGGTAGIRTAIDNWVITDGVAAAGQPFRKRLGGIPFAAGGRRGVW